MPIDAAPPQSSNRKEPPSHGLLNCLGRVLGITSGTATLEGASLDTDLISVVPRSVVWLFQSSRTDKISLLSSENPATIT